MTFQNKNPTKMIQFAFWCYFNLLAHFKSIRKYCFKKIYISVGNLDKILQRGFVFSLPAISVIMMTSLNCTNFFRILERALCWMPLIPSWSVEVLILGLEGMDSPPLNGDLLFRSSLTLPSLEDLLMSLHNASYAKMEPIESPIKQTWPQNPEPSSDWRKLAKISFALLTILDTELWYSGEDPAKIGMVPIGNRSLETTKSSLPRPFKAGITSKLF